LNRADSNTGVGIDEVERALGQKVRYVLRSGGAGPVRAANHGRPLVMSDPKNPLAKSLSAIAQDMVNVREGARRRRRWFAFEPTRTRP